MQTTGTDKPSKLFVIRDYAVLALIILCIVFRKDTSVDTINYPDYIVYYAAAAIVIVVILIRFRKFEEKYISLKRFGDRLFYAAVCLVVTVIGALTLAYMVLIPFNYYNVHVAKQNTADTVHCNIDSAVIGLHTGNEVKPNTIYYHFQNRPNSIENTSQTKLIATMHALHAESMYNLKLTVHKALLGSYWLQDWKMESKPAAPAYKPK
jgi:hypothetical protein